MFIVWIFYIVIFYKCLCYIVILYLWCKVENEFVFVINKLKILLSVSGFLFFYVCKDDFYVCSLLYFFIL